VEAGIIDLATKSGVLKLLYVADRSRGIHASNRFLIVGKTGKANKGAGKAQPALSHIKKTETQPGITLAGSVPRAVSSLYQALANLLTDILKHGVRLAGFWGDRFSRYTVIIIQGNYTNVTRHLRLLSGSCQLVCW
jgi:hypothetical protein